MSGDTLPVQLMISRVYFHVSSAEMTTRSYLPSMEPLKALQMSSRYAFLSPKGEEEKTKKIHKCQKQHSPHL